MSALSDRLYKLHDRLRTLSHDLAESGDALKALPSEKRGEEAQACLEAAQALAWRSLATGSSPPNSQRVLLCWEGTEALAAHVELGWRKFNTDEYVNTYGKEFGGPPTHWLPLAAPPIGGNREHGPKHVVDGGDE